jgi:sodium transport system permease protein
MKFNQIKVVYLKEMTDILRDRRTLISMILLPIILFPVMTIGIGALMGGQIKKMEQKSYQIVFISRERAPELYSYLQETKQFQIIDEARDTSLARNLLKEKTVKAVVYNPDSLEMRLQAFFRQQSEAPNIEIWTNEAEVAGEIVSDKLREFLKDYRQRVVEAELARLQIRSDMTKPFVIQTINIASEEEMGGFVAGMILPYMVIMLALVGAMYPAIDLTAGEKERGTLETLLIAPVGRMEMVVGKFFTVMTASLATACLAVTSMSITLSSGFSMFPESGAIRFAPGLTSVLGVLLLMVPLAMLFSALLLTVALFARSYREAQSYISPLMILVIVPAMVSYMPGIEPDWQLALIPVVNVALMLKATMTNNIEWSLILFTFLSTLIYASVAVFISFRQFQRESVLFRL